jgi:predicted transcriptional regulator
MLNVYFKQTMDHFGVKGSELAEAFGRDSNYVSKVRTGNISPPIGRFWELIETLDKLSPGAKKYFGNLIAENKMDFFVEDLLQITTKEELAAAIVSLGADRIVAAMSNEQLSQIMLAIAMRMKDSDKSSHKSEETVAA